MYASAKDARTTDSIDLVEVLDALSMKGSTWTRADVLRAVCDIAPPVTGYWSERPVVWLRPQGLAVCQR